MRAIKNLIPVILLIIAAGYSFNHYALLPKAILNAVIFLPIVLAIVVLVLSAHFNRSKIFFYAVIISITNIVFGLGLGRTPLTFSLLSGLVPITLVAITLMPDRGIFSMRAIPAHLVITGTLLISLILISIHPEWLNHLLFTDWLPRRYFDWTIQPQTVIYTSIVMFITMLVYYFVQPTPLSAASLGIMIMLIVQLNFGESDRSLNVFSTTALLMCLYAVLQESWRMAYLDELTELPARRALKERFQKIGGTYSVAMLDVDHFKKFNDTYGHDTGDAVLRMIAGKLRKVTGKGAVYRYGGEEFSVVFNGKTIEEATPHLEELRESIAVTPFVVNRASRRKNDASKKRSRRKTVQVTVSIGVADSIENADNAWGILKQADKALYNAKASGRNCVCS